MNRENILNKNLWIMTVILLYVNNYIWIIDSKHSDVSKTSSNTGNKFHIDEIPPPIILVLNSPGEAAAEEREVGEEGKEAGKEGREAGEEMRQELDVSADENIQTETVNEGWHAR